MTDEETLTACASCLDFPEEEEEDFDDCAHRATSTHLLWASETSPRVSACARPRHDLHRACKHVVYRAWYLNIVPKEISLSLSKLNQNKKKGRPRKLGGVILLMIVFEL